MGRKANGKRQSCPRHAATEDLNDRVHVAVHGLAGNTLEFLLANDRSIVSVKNRVGREWSMPPACLKILSLGHLLDDAETIADHCDEQGVAHFQVITSTSVLYEQLESDRVQPRLDALADLQVVAQNSQEDDEQFVTAVCACLEDADKSVRCAAVGAIESAICKGNAFAVAEIIRRLRSRRPEVRIVAVQALSSVVERGDGGAIEVLLELLDDILVQSAVAKLLGDVCEHGNADARVIQALVVKLTSRDPAMVVAVAESLGQLAGQDDPHVIEALSCRAFRESDHWRKSSRHTICVLTDTVCSLAPRIDEERATQLLLDLVYGLPCASAHWPFKVFITLARVAQPEDNRVHEVFDGLRIEDTRVENTRDHRLQELRQAVSGFRKRAGQSR